MTLEQLIGKYARLRAEHAAACRGAVSEQHAQRLGNEIASIERAIVEAQPLDEQTCDYFPAFVSEP